MSPKRRLEEARAGEEIGPHHYRLTREMAEFAASNLGIHKLEVDGSGNLLAPSCVTDNDYALAWMQVFTAREAVHTKADHHYLNVPLVGKELIITGKIVERYNKRGRDFLVFETVTRDEDGREIVKSVNHLLISL